MRTRAKICGITRPQDGIVAAANGADAIGLVFFEKSPRNIGIDQARAVIAALPPFVTSVGLFVNAQVDEVEQILSRVPLDLLQFHGEETPEYCRQFARPYIKAVRMADGVDLELVAQQYADANGLLVDSYQKGVPGGTGHTFDWGRIPSGMDMPIILAGGLGPGNIEQAVRQVHPYAVDVSSGVEADKGIKDADKIAAFMRGVKKADGE